jgi:hypothetical protein
MITNEIYPQSHNQHNSFYLLVFSSFLLKTYITSDDGKEKTEFYI